jgi:hypothetical protein
VDKSEFLFFPKSLQLNQSRVKCKVTVQVDCPIFCAWFGECNGRTQPAVVAVSQGRYNGQPIDGTAQHDNNEFLSSWTDLTADSKGSMTNWQQYASTANGGAGRKPVKEVTTCHGDLLEW